MEKHTYSKGFEAFWREFIKKTPSPEGQKLQAWDVWKEKGLEYLTEEIIHGIDVCLSNDTYFKNKGQFVAPWKHGCRWLKYEAWNAVDRAEIERNKAVESRKRQIEQEQEKKYLEMRDYLMENRDKWIELEPKYPNQIARARKEIGLCVE